MEIIKTVDMTRKIRDEQYILTKEMSQQELIAFFHNKAEKANKEALSLLKKRHKSSHITRQ